MRGGRDRGAAAERYAWLTVFRDPILLVLAVSAAAAIAAGLGALPHLGRRSLPTRWIGWANAVAGGAMLGAAFALSAAGAETTALPTALGAVVGVGFIYWTHAAAGTHELDLNRLEGTDPAYGYQVLLINGLHGASEGVAIAAAMLIGIPFGLFVALVIAAHNVPEGTVLSAVLRGRGISLPEAAGLAVAVNTGQALMAVATFAVVRAAPGALPWVTGFAVGALAELTLLELLPESYREAGPTSIAVVTVVAMGVVILVEGLLA